MRNLQKVLPLLALVFLWGCAALQPQIATPQISVTSLRLLPTAGMSPRFEVGLHLVNPNPIPLPLKGISYKVRLEEYDILNGASSNLPPLKAYGEIDFRVRATVDLLSGLQLINELLARPHQEVSYQLEAKLDHGKLLPQLLLRTGGRIQLKRTP